MNYEILLTSPPNRDSVVAEIYLGHEQFAELRNDGDAIRVEVYKSTSGTAWDIPYNDLVSLLSAAKHKLVGPDQ